ncbi:Pentatricopeptide repeat-containing protein [Vitis vinifera]|uniref:Pentatricopeptide repeat-containing protein n=1 Tax=Vitis vinifera TaxID=29760 RepID=A0A438JE33_VITVI|nr:Pentatricopeptide repeat-containing protein [Vitis vinifera]
MVDLYGRAGRLNEIKEFIHNNAISKLSSVWRSFLSSCRVHKNIEMGIWVCKKLLELEPFDAGPYILFSSICATEQRWEEAAKIRSLMQQRGVKKNPSQSWIQLKNHVHSFVMGDRSHPQDTKIYSYLDELIGRLKEIGYSTDVTPVMQDVEQEQRQVLLGYHSEKLAIAYGIISTAPGTPIRTTGDAASHQAINYASEYSPDLIAISRKQFIKGSSRPGSNSRPPQFNEEIMVVQSMISSLLLLILTLMPN